MSIPERVMGRPIIADPLGLSGVPDLNCMVKDWSTPGGIILKLINTSRALETVPMGNNLDPVVFGK